MRDHLPKLWEFKNTRIVGEVIKHVVLEQEQPYSRMREVMKDALLASKINRMRMYSTPPYNTNADPRDRPLTDVRVTNGIQKMWNIKAVRAVGEVITHA